MRYIHRMSNYIVLERLDALLKTRSTTDRSASLAAGLSGDAIRNIRRSSTNSANARTLTALSDYFGCGVAFLIGEDDTPREEVTIPLVGYIGAAGEVYPIDDYAKGDGMDNIAPEGYYSENAVAVVVRGNSMFDRYRDGDVLIYDERRTDIESFVGKRDCVVQLADNRIMVKRITRGSETGFYTLISSNHPPIEDVALQWCARIRAVQYRDE